MGAAGLVVATVATARVFVGPALVTDSPSYQALASSEEMLRASVQKSVQLAMRRTEILAHEDSIRRALATRDTTAVQALPISKALVERLGGTIAAASRPREGTTVTVCLPLLPAAAPDAAAPAPSKRPGPAVGVRLDGVRILVADDMRDNQRLISTYLRRAGAVVEIVEDGDQAVQRLQNSALPPVDVTLMDIQMPNLDGEAATGRLRAGGYERPIIAMTAHAMAGEHERLLALGCSDYIAKPLDREHLLALCALWAERAAASTPGPSC